MVFMIIPRFSWVFMIFIDFQWFQWFSMISLNLWLLAPTNVAPNVDPYSSGCRRQWRQPLNFLGKSLDLYLGIVGANAKILYLGIFGAKIDILYLGIVGAKAGRVFPKITKTHPKLIKKPSQSCCWPAAKDVGSRFAPRVKICRTNCATTTTRINHLSAIGSLRAPQCSGRLQRTFAATEGNHRGHLHEYPEEDICTAHEQNMIQQMTFGQHRVQELVPRCGAEDFLITFGQVLDMFWPTFIQNVVPGIHNRTWTIKMSSPWDRCEHTGGNMSSA